MRTDQQTFNTKILFAMFSKARRTDKVKLPILGNQEVSQTKKISYSHGS